MTYSNLWRTLHAKLMQPQTLHRMNVSFQWMMIKDRALVEIFKVDVAIFTGLRLNL